MKPNLFLVGLFILAACAFPTNVEAGTLTLNWNDNSSNEAGFKIERKAGTAGTFAEIATVAANTTIFVDPSLAEGQEFCYRVRAYNDGGDSTYTNEDCATTTVIPPIPTPPDGATVGPAKVIIIIP